MRFAKWLLAVWVLGGGSARATVPASFSVQGVLRDSTGKLQSMMVNVTVKLYADQSGGSALATPLPSTAVMAANGLFTVTINVDSTLMGVLATPPIWLELTVGNDTFPRQLVTPGVYALMCSSADNALQLGGKDAGLYLLSADAATAYQPKGNYLGATATATDSAKLGNVAAANYVQHYANNGKTMTVAGKYCGVTATSYDGAGVGGYAGGKAKCETKCGDVRAHMCMTDELIRWYATGSTVTSGWFAGGIAFNTAGGSSGECLGYSSSDGTYFGSVWSSTGYPTTGPCSSSFPIICCL